MPLDIGKSSVDISADQFRRELLPDDARPQAQHIHAVILNTLMRRKRVMTGGGADAAKLVRRHARASARPANQNGSPSMAIAQSFRYGAGKVRIVDGIGRMGP